MSDKLYPVLSIIYFVTVIVQYAINALASAGPDGTIFLNKTGDLSRVYKTEITPAGWTFSIWGFIYTWQALWVVYSLVNICRKGPNGPAYCDPRFLPLPLFGLGIVISALNITWLITFDRQEIEVSCAALIVYSIFMYISLAVSYVALDQSSPKLSDQNRTLDIWLTRGLVHNGLAIQATWVTIASLLNVSMVMSYSADPSISIETSGTIALSILSAEIVLFVSTDLLVLDRYTRYTITPYIVLVVALIGSISKNWEEGSTNSTFTAILLAVAGVALLVKLIVTLVKHMKGSRYRTSYDPSIGEKNSGGILA